MKLKHLLFPFIFFTVQFIIHSVAQDMKLEWVKDMGNNQTMLGVNNTAVSKVDRNGNVYSTGCFFDTVDFDPGPAACILDGSLFIQKLDSSGNFLWAKTLMASARINGFALDASNNIYLTGHFSGTADFDPGPGVFNLTCTGAITDVFILKLDANGIFCWARSIGGAGEDRGSSVCTDPAGNIYCCGHYNTSADLDPGPGVFNVTTINSTFFILKLNAAGNFIWGKSMGFGDIFSYDDYQIASDASGNIYSTGRFDYTADFDPGPGVCLLTTNGLQTDVFIQKLDSSGNFIWAKSFGGTRLEVCRSFAIDAGNNIYTTGFFDGTPDFDPGPGVFTMTSVYAAQFVQKLDVNGNFLWAKFIGKDSSSVFPTGIALDKKNDAYLTGYYYGTVDFNPGPQTYYLSPEVNSTGLYILKLDASGNFCCARSMGGQDYYSISNSISVDACYNIYTTGSFSGTVDFDLESGVSTLTNTGSPDIFIQKISQCGLMHLELGNDTIICKGINFSLNAAIDNGIYSWQDHSTDSFFVPEQSGLYYVNVSAGNCRLSDSIHVQIIQAPVVDLGNDSILCEGEVLQLRATNEYSNYIWQDNSSDSTLTVTKNGTYRVDVRNVCGVKSDEINVSFENCDCIFIPNSFTPNRDGVNDYFSSTSRCTISDYSLTIYNRWGEKIFESKNPEIYWDGRNKDKDVAGGVYVYELAYKPDNKPDRIKQYGHITLIR